MNRLEKIIQEILQEKKAKRDRCLKIADRKFDKPSAYKSGAVVRCRKGNIWKGLKEGEYDDKGEGAGYDLVKQNPFNIKKLVDKGIIFVTKPGDGKGGLAEPNWEGDLSVITYYNIKNKVDPWMVDALKNLLPQSIPYVQKDQDKLIYNGKYNQILWGIEQKGFKPEDFYLSLKEQLDESKQVGIIYHYTTFEAGLKILQFNQLKSSEAADSTKNKPVFGISFTRDKRFHENHNVGFDESSFGNTPQLRFTIDGNKLSNRFSVQPYSQGGVFDKGKKSFEAEERVISIKPFTIPLSDYLISVDILVEYKKPGKDDWDMEWDYKTYAPIRAEIVKFSQDKNIPINLIVNKNGDPWPDKAKKTIIQKILNWFSIKEADDPQSGKAAPYGSGYAKLKDIIKEIIQEDESLHKWFKRSGAPGKEKGWVDCNSPIRKDGKITGYKSCGRKKGEKRAKYPSCRPTAAKCKDKGKGTKWGKTK